MIRSALVVVVVLGVAGPVWGGPIVFNGSFELGPPPFSVHDIDIPTGSTAITGWLVTGSGVDLLEEPWDVSAGIRAIDLDGRSPGGIQQTFATEAGQTYNVSFGLSGNPEGGPIQKLARVTVGDFTGDYLFDTAGQTIDSLLWQTVMFSFTAPETAATLSFLSLSSAGNSYGALIDGVSVTPVPEPSTWLLVGSGALLIARARRRRRSRVP
jgi:choice-of-anchor C domain-containing protein